MKIFTPFRTLLLAGIAMALPATVSARVVGGYCGPRGGVYISSGAYCAPRAYCAPAYAYRPYCGPRAYWGAPVVSFGIYSTPAYYSSGYYYDSYPTRTFYRGVAVDTSYRTTARYDEDLSVDVQRALSRRGYYRGEIDGDVGPATRSAIRSYQYNRGLEVTGRIDNALLRSLNLS
jgi:hypothetical protein